MKLIGKSGKNIGYGMGYNHIKNFSRLPHIINNIHLYIIISSRYSPEEKN